MRRLLLVAAFTALMVMASAPAFAGEWNKGHFNEPGGNLPAKYHANSECVYNGLDEPDATEHPGEDPFADDGLWGLTPAGGKVQSGGQMIAALKQGVDLGIPPEGTPFPGVQRFACNGHLNPLK
jgi:hypothetical protein